jgi:rhomboid family GlyGly-CTERM serine protease
MLRVNAIPISATQITGPLVLLGLLLVCDFIGAESLLYTRDLIIAGETWRLLTASFVHLSVNHALLNATGVVVLWLLHGDYYDSARYIGIIMLSSLGTTLGLLVFSSDLVWYAGLSGALHGIFVWGMGRDFEHGERTAWLLGAGLLIKLSWEYIYGGDPAVAHLIGSQVVVDAHLYGSASGLLIVLTGFAYRKAFVTTL